MHNVCTANKNFLITKREKIHAEKHKLNVPEETTV